MNKIIYGLLFGACGVCIAVWCIRSLESRMVFFPMKGIASYPSGVSLAFEEVSLPAGENVTLNGWFIPRAGARHTLLFLHGNAGNIGHRLEKLRMLHEAGVAIFIIDYRGYGKSSGTPTEEGLYRDAAAAYEYLLAKRGVSAEHIILFGESLGTAVAVDLASRSKVGGVILEGAFSSAADMARRYYPYLPGFLVSVKLDSSSKIAHVSAPKLLIHSRDDEIVPIGLGKKLYRCASAPKEFVEISGGHNTAFMDSRHVCISAIRKFLTL
ncbi:MAG: alpha/beta hydrolase [Candidatus Omnitrophota bacterium]